MAEKREVAMQGVALQNKMRIILLMVQTINGKITHGDESDIHLWTSKEDSSFLFSFLRKHKLIVMGSGTYEAAKKMIKVKSGQLRIILTKDPKRYKKEEVVGGIEFRNDSPSELVKEMEKIGYKNMILLGGGTLNTSFFQENLVDELYLTIEPRIFGEGRQLINEGKFESILQLQSVKKLNKQGTLLLHYLVKR